MKEVEFVIKKLLILATITTAIFTSGCGEVNLGYLDKSKIMEAPQIKTIADEGNTKLQEAQTEVIKAFTENQNGTDEEKQKVQAEAQRKLQGIQQAYASQIQQKIDAALADIVKSKNVEIVIDNSKDQPVLFEGGIDLTDEVIQKLQ